MSSLLLAEIFTLSLSNSNVACFELNPKIERNEGNKLSFHLNRNLPRISVVWHQGYFYALSKIDNGSNYKLSQEEWQEILESVQDLLKDYKERCFQVKLIEIAQMSPSIKAQLACQILSKPQTKFEIPDAIPL
ncbi:hypothetical protein [Gloeothece verrucosa]|uniref:hypothetical protein n=1 Tax=Gloeothece verrucosa TaxID=2546359 RepID=UPI00017E2A46|nr:hypothetical protein [Gloeothece verrucosa]